MKRGFQKSFPQVRMRILGFSLLILFFFSASSSPLVSAFNQEENVKHKRIPERFVEQKVFSRLAGSGGLRGGGGGSSGGRGGSVSGGGSRGDGKGSGSNVAGAAGAGGAANIPHHKPLHRGNSNCSTAKVALTLYALLVLASLVSIY